MKNNGEKDIIKLPNTKFKKTDDINFSTPIQEDSFLKIINGDLILEEGNYYTDFPYLQI